MNKTAAILIVAGSLLSGCVAYETPAGGAAYGVSGSYYSTDGRAYYSRDGHNYYQRRDRDGVRNSEDRAPDDSRRY
jgi:hypothetical protein